MRRRPGHRLVNHAGVHVDPVAHRTRRGRSAARAHVDRATQLFGSPPPPAKSITGVAGLTLGGGWVTHRAFGLACDNLRSMEIVIADGIVRTASLDEHLISSGPHVVAAKAQARRSSSTSTGSTRCAIAQATPTTTPKLPAPGDLPRRPDTISPRRSCGPSCPIPPCLEALRPLHTARRRDLRRDPADAADVLAPSAVWHPAHRHEPDHPYVAVQSAFDPRYPTAPATTSNRFMDELTDEAIAALVACSLRLPITSRSSSSHPRGAIARVSPDDSAYPHRSARFNVSIDGVWSDPTHDTAVISWARHTWNTMRPFANGGVYLNFAGLDGDEDVTPHDTFGANLSQRERIRTEYDPDRIFEATARRP